MNQGIMKALAIVTASAALATTPVAEVGTTNAQAKTKISKYTWSSSKAPNYVVKVGKAHVTNKQKPGHVKYSQSAYQAL